MIDYDDYKSISRSERVKGVFSDRTVMNQLGLAEARFKIGYKKSLYKRIGSAIGSLLCVSLITVVGLWPYKLTEGFDQLLYWLMQSYLLFWLFGFIFLSVYNWFQNKPTKKRIIEYLELNSDIEYEVQKNYKVNM